jgi:hypothetical protein
MTDDGHDSDDPSAASFWKGPDEKPIYLPIIPPRGRSAPSPMGEAHTKLLASGGCRHALSDLVPLAAPAPEGRPIGKTSMRGRKFASHFGGRQSMGPQGRNLVMISCRGWPEGVRGSSPACQPPVMMKLGFGLHCL